MRLGWGLNQGFPFSPQALHCLTSSVVDDARAQGTTVHHDFWGLGLEKGWPARRLLVAMRTPGLGEVHPVIGEPRWGNAHRPHLGFLTLCPQKPLLGVFIWYSFWVGVLTASTVSF